jgi:hypothetical protein
VGAFDCTKPADGTPLLTCCQGPPGNLIQCGNIITKQVVYTPSFWLNVNTCQLFRTMTVTVGQYNSSNVLEFDRIEVHDYRLNQNGEVDYSVTSTTPAGLNDFNFMCGNLNERVISFSCNQAGETFTVRCLDSNGNPLTSTKWVYDIAFTNPITWQDLLGPWNQLLNYTSSNFEAIADGSIAFDRNGNISTGSTFSLPPTCQTGDIRDLNNGAIGGMLRKASIGAPIGYWSSASGPWKDPATSQSKCGFRRVDFNWKAWFSRVDLSQYYQVERINLRSIPPPTVCPSLSPLLNDNLDCESVQVLEFADGLNDNGGQRRPIFGPINYDPHITITRCRS